MGDKRDLENRILLDEDFILELCEKILNNYQFKNEINEMVGSKDIDKRLNFLEANKEVTEKSELNSLKKENKTLQSQISELQRANSNLNNTNDNYEEKLKGYDPEWEKKLNNTLIEYGKLNDEYGKLNDKYKILVAEYNDSFYAKAKNVYRESYNALSLESKKSLENCFPSNTLQGFVASGLQWENISSIWDLMRTMVIKNQLNDLDKLKNIFIFFFNFYNSSYNSPRFKLEEPLPNSKYDNRNCFILGTQTDGIIDSVPLFGYTDTTLNETKKAIVILKA